MGAFTSVLKTAICQSFAGKRLLLLLAAAVMVSLNALATDPGSQIIINEFLAGNNTDLEDVDGDNEDWIELYNADTVSINLAGWCLSDDPANLTKWSFPATNLGPNAYLVVFASGKNRAIPGAQLHTNFKLTPEPGFLALTRPDLSVASSFNYPGQKSDVSFGPLRSTQPLLAAGAPIKWLVPLNGSLGTNWTGANEPFNDAGWPGGVSGIGFIGTNGGAGSYSNLVGSDAGLVAYWRLGEASGSAAADVTAAHNGTLSGSYLRNQGGVLSGDPNPSTDFTGGRVTVPHHSTLNSAGNAFTVEAWVRPRTTSQFAWLVAKESDNTSLDYLLGLNPNGAFRFITQGLANDVAAGSPSVLDGTRWYHVVGVQDPVANRVTLYVNGAYVNSVPRAASGITSANSLLIGDRSSGGQTISGRIDEVAIYQRALGSNEVRLHYQTGTNSLSVFTSLIGTNLQSTMQGVNASAYLRIPFVVTNLAAMKALTLRLCYEDGFVAYVNGVEVARRNAPTTPVWNSTATAARTTGEAVIPEAFDLSAYLGALHAGTNVLAIQGLNVSNAETDFLIFPQLEASFLFTDQPQFFTPPTPGTANGQAWPGWVADTHFSVDRGFFNAPFNVAISCATPNATIRYTTNFSAPDATHGLIYTGPVPVGTTAALRAIATLPDYIPSDVDTHTYLFTNDIIHQPASPAGLPSSWNGFTVDYAMDQNVVNLAQTYSVATALRSLPTLSIVTESDNIFGAASGIYVNSELSGELWERPVSAELINPDNTTAFQLNCGIRIQGASSRNPGYTPKHSFRLLFKSIYGPSKLHHPLFPDSTVERFDGLTLRSFYTDAWVANRLALDRFRPEDAQYQRDLWMKDTQLAMGQLAPHNVYCHLYINGLYWGLYNMAERPDASFNAAYRGGAKENYDILKDYQEVQNGDATAFYAMFAIANRSAGHARSVANALGYADLEQYLDIPELIDYMLLHIYAGAEDWPTHNWYCGRLRATGAQFKFFTWDQEIAIDSLTRDRSGVSDDLTPARLYSQLRQNPEFRVQFGDHIQQHLFNGGAMMPSNNIARYLARAAQIDRGVVAESARWGDVQRTPAFNRDGDWLGVQRWEVTNYFPNIHALALQRFISAGLYSSIGAPNFSQFGGAVPSGYGLVITHTNTSGSLFFTVDGSDPRVPGTGAVSASAQAYSAPIIINTPTEVRARVLKSGAWSALVKATFFPPQDLGKLVLTEIMYHSPDLGTTNGDELDFIELKNTGTNTLNLSGLNFSTGIAFVFTNGTLLAPGQFFVLARSLAAMAVKYPGLVIRGVFTGKLDNGGETLTLSEALGAKVLSVDYDDAPPWPVTPDGLGYSLVQQNPGASQAPDDGARWRASTNPGGSPGADDPAPGIPAVVINEILTHTDLPQLDSIELYNPASTNVDISGWYLTDEVGTPKKFRIPNGTTLSAGGKIVFNEAQFNPTPGLNNSFALDSAGDDIYLFSATTNGVLTSYCHGVAVGAAFNGVSFGRYINSVGEEQFPAQISLTPGQPNSGPRIGPVVISEINYHPDTGGDTYVELVNITGTNVSLFDPAHPANTWKLNGYGFTFPANITLAAGQMIVLVSTNPVTFRTKYNVPAGVQIFGPASGALQNDGELLELQSPDTPGLNGVVPYVTRDAVHYHDKAPWPPAADGSGQSLQRLQPDAYGNDPVNWAAAGPTPGQAYGTGDSDGDGLPDAWEIEHGTLVNVPDADNDPDADGFTNWQEYQAGTDPLDVNSSLQWSTVSAAGGQFRLEFYAVSNHTYSILYKSSLDAAGWSKLVDVSAQTTNRWISVTNPLVGSAARFYRLSCPAQP